MKQENKFADTEIYTKPGDLKGPEKIDELEGIKSHIQTQKDAYIRIVGKTFKDPTLKYDADGKPIDDGNGGFVKIEPPTDKKGKELFDKEVKAYTNFKAEYDKQMGIFDSKLEGLNKDIEEAKAEQLKEEQKAEPAKEGATPPKEGAKQPEQKAEVPVGNKAAEPVGNKAAARPTTVMPKNGNITYTKT